MLLCLTASHKTAPFDLLERLSVGTDGISTAIAGNGECVRGAIVLATCNRFEAYLDMDEPVTAAAAIGVEAAVDAVSAATGIAADEFDGSYTVLSGDRVAEHLFSVAAGLESVVVGEGEIAGQVRRALVEARTGGTASPELERLFQRASEAQRGVKNATALGRAGRSLVRLSLDLADSRIADWTAVRVLLVGTGQYAAATLAALRDRGVDDIVVWSPSGRGERFARKHGLGHTDRQGMPRVAASADLVITCTTADHAVLGPDDLRAAPVLRAVGETDAPAALPRQRLVIDLGMPRNVERAVAALPDVQLLDLETIRLHAPLEELQATERAREIVGDAARRFTRAGDAQSVAPAVVALRSHAFSLLDDEIQRLPRVDGAVDPRAEQALRHLVGRLLHAPTVRAQELASAGRAEEYTRALSTLFGIDVAEPADEQSGDGRDDEASATA